MTKKIVFDATKLNDYKKGRISGMCYIIAGMPEKTWGWCKRDSSNECLWFFEATDEQHQTAIETIEKVYPGVIIYKES
jgi:hypothetical protein